MREVARPAAAEARFADVPFAVERIVAMSAEGPLAGRLDPDRMGMSGHSYGAISTLVAAGQRLPDAGQRYAVPRFKGAFAMSPGPPRRGSAEEAFDDMLMPIFHLTGTADGSPLSDLEPSARETLTLLGQHQEQVLVGQQDELAVAVASTLPPALAVREVDAGEDAAVEAVGMALVHDEVVEVGLEPGRGPALLDGPSAGAALGGAALSFGRVSYRWRTFTTAPRATPRR